MATTRSWKKVNRERKVALRYRVNQSSVPDGALVWWLIDGPDPEGPTQPGSPPPLEASRDQLLSRPVGVLRGVKITVRDLILYFSNVAGGVHMGEPKTKKERTLAELEGRLPQGELAGRKGQAGI